MKVHKINSILCITSMFICVTYCEPSGSRSKMTPKHMLGFKGAGINLVDKDQAQNLEKECGIKKAAGSRQFVHDGLRMNTKEFDIALRDYLEENGCTKSNVYKDFLKEKGLSPGPIALAEGANSNGDSGYEDGDSGDGDGDSGDGDGGSGDGDGDSGDGDGGSGDYSGETTDPNASADAQDPVSNLDPSLTYYFDMDLDGYGSDDPEDIYSYLPSAAYSTNNEDCDDDDKDINPGVNEDCKDGVDNNCDGETDEMKYFTDKDQDTYGTDEETEATEWNTCLYSPSTNIDLLKTNSLSHNNDDCNDNDAAVQFETDWYIDEDDDGWGKKGSDPIKQCSGEDETSIELQDSKYVKNPNDCLDALDDDGEEQKEGSNIDNDPDCDGFYDGSENGEDCDNTAGDTVFNQYSQSSDKDCDSRLDFEDDGDQLDWCIKYDDNEDTDYSTTKPSLFLADLKGSNYEDKIELHKCGNDYDMDGCWNWSEECNDPNYSVTTSDNEDCEDGTKDDGAGSNAGSSNRIYSRFLQWDEDDNNICDLVEFKNVPSGASADYYRVQVKKGSTWYDICSILDASTFDVWIDDDSKSYHCYNGADTISSSGELDHWISGMGDGWGTSTDGEGWAKGLLSHNFYFQIWSNNATHTWAKNDSIILRTAHKFGLQGKYAALQRSAYVRVDGTMSIESEAGSDGDGTWGQDISDFEGDGTQVVWDSGEEYQDNSRAYYPIISNAFYLSSQKDGSSVKWSHSAWSLVMANVHNVYVRFIKALCVPDKTLEQMLEDPSVVIPKQENCSHYYGKNR